MAVLDHICLMVYLGGEGKIGGPNCSIGPLHSLLLHLHVMEYLEGSARITKMVPMDADVPMEAFLDACRVLFPP